MRIALYAPSYPSEGEPYNYAFVHLRAKLYIEEGHDVKVFTPNSRTSTHYTFESVDVYTGNSDYLSQKIRNFDPTSVAVHSPRYIFHENIDMIKFIEKNLLTENVTFWFHGVESLKLSYYTFPEIQSAFDIPRGVYNWITHNIQLSKMKKLMKKTRGQFNHVFVSDWMHQAVEKSLSMDVKPAHIIPNPIDEQLFDYSQKSPEERYELLSIRPFSSRKYANDRTVKVMNHLDQGQLDLYGKGRLLEKNKKLSTRNNITFHEKFVEHNQIPKLHKQNGIFLCPTRADSQGVSMCEAMSSGLPVITNRTQAIPEFVEQGISGFLCDSVEEMTKRIQQLIENPNLYLEMSRKAAKSIRKICGSKNIIPKELDVLR